MSLVDDAIEVLEKTQASLQSLLAEAIKTKAYNEIITIAAMAESVAAIGHEGRRASATEAWVGPTAAPAGPTEAPVESAAAPVESTATPVESTATPAESPAIPSWMRRRKS